MGFLDVIRSLVVGQQPLVGDVLPQRAPPQVPAFDGRTAALRALRGYLCALSYHRENQRGMPPIAFQLLAKNFHIDYPDGEQGTDFAAGTAVVVPTGRFTYEPQGLATFLDEASWDAYGPNTVVQVMGTYVERFNLEYRCALKQQRRAFKGSVEVAFSPVENVAVLRLKTTGYYGQNAAFALKDGALLDSADEARGRRAVQLGIELSVQVVRLVNALTLRPVLQVVVDTDQGTGLPMGPTVANQPDGS